MPKKRFVPVLLTAAGNKDDGGKAFFIRAARICEGVGKGSAILNAFISIPVFNIPCLIGEWRLWHLRPQLLLYRRGIAGLSHRQWKRGAALEPKAVDSFFIRTKDAGILSV